MSKFERYKKKSEDYVYPHKHCQICGEMIDESLKYCSSCYKKLKEKEKKKKNRFRFWKKSENDDSA
ncbi:MAG: DUF2116 family Zn-ribbon domain-containing protein [Promethearchaeota archaeon]|nr:MAG: DUF2116 family Zn-ribbon domain-containing protein [Candidatus Lokiarchaeota archaeon]